MFVGLRETWSRHAVGYRQGRLDDGDAVAAMVVVVIGGPLFLVGGMLTHLDGLSILQVMLLAPLAGLLGGFLLGAGASAAASTGATASWLLRPAFGRLGSVVVSSLRLVLVMIWTVVGLQIVGGWTSEVVPGNPDPVLGILGVALLGLLLTMLGVVRTTRRVVRKPLFIASVALVGYLAWRFASQLDAFAGGAGGSFWAGLQRAVELSVVFLPFVEVLGRQLHDEEAAQSSFGVGYAIPATVMLLAGALMATGLGSLPRGVVGADLGTLGLLGVLAWVIIAEVDQAYAGFVAAGSEGSSVLRFGTTPVIGSLFVAGIVGLAVFGAHLPLDWAALLAAVVLPAAVIGVMDFHMAHDHHYAESDMYGEGSTEGLVNLYGVSCWVLAVMVGQILDPIGPEGIVGALPALGMETDLPWRLLSAVVFGLLYTVLVRIQDRRRTAVFGLRGID